MDDAEHFRQGGGQAFPKPFGKGILISLFIHGTSLFPSGALGRDWNPKGAELLVLGAGEQVVES